MFNYFKITIKATICLIYNFYKHIIQCCKIFCCLLFTPLSKYVRIPKMKTSYQFVIGIAIFTVSFLSMYKGVLYFDNKNSISSISHNNVNSSSNISKSPKYIEANLVDMKLSLIENNEVKKIFNIVTIGKPGSYYETPVGEFAIKSKDINRYSNMGEVYMPYAMQFFGNFFIHGIPYYKNGEKVSTDYSGGCIRMKDEDMKEIYEFADINTDLIIKNNYTPYYSDQEFDNDTIDSMMSILISLETINQEKYVRYGKHYVKFKDLNYYIAKGDQQAKQLVKNYLGNNVYQKYMSERLTSMDIKNINLRSEKEKFVSNIVNNKKYIINYFN